MSTAMARWPGVSSSGIRGFQYAAWPPAPGINTKVATHPPVAMVMSAKHRAWVERDPDPGDAAVLDMTPVGDRHWTCGGGPQLEPSQHVRSVNPAMDHLHLSGHREHATQPAEGLRDAVGFAEGTDEIDICVQQRPHPLDIVGLPGVKVSTGDRLRRVIRTHPLSMLATNSSLAGLADPVFSAAVLISRMRGVRGPTGIELSVQGRTTAQHVSCL